MGNKRFNLFALLPMMFILLLPGIRGISQVMWNPGHSIGTINGVYSYPYNTTPAQIVEINPAAIPNTGLTYVWWSSPNPVTGFAVIPGANQSSYSPAALTTSSVTMYYYRVTSGSLGSIISNTVKIAVVSQNWEDLSYVREHDVLVAGQTTWTAVDQLAIGSKLQKTDYMDGLGRPVESVGKQISTPAAGTNTWGDVVELHQYDPMSRESQRYLPYSTTNQSGFYKTSAVTDQAAYYANAATYNESSPFSSITYEQNPLNRVSVLHAPGGSWAASIGASTIYDMNTAADNVRIWGVDYIQGHAPVNHGVYTANKLYKTTKSDVNGNQVVEFRDMLGELILQKVQAVPTIVDAYTSWICTYYVYDDYGQMRFQIQPEGVKYLNANSWSFGGANGSTVLAEYVFQHNYDDKKRSIWKKAPGASAHSIIYDARDRLVFTQDGNQAAMTPTPQWTATIYDGLDRVVLTTLYNTSETVANLQTDLANAAATNNTYTTAGTTKPLMDLVVDSRDPSISSYAAQNSVTLTPGFSSVANDNFSISINGTATATTGGSTVSTYGNPISTTNLGNNAVCTIQKYVFYDTYSFQSAKAFDNSFTNTSAYSPSDPSVLPIVPSKRTLGMSTGTMTRVLGSSIFLALTTYYDEKGHLIQSLEDNIKTGTEILTRQYYFDSRLLSLCNSHSNVAAGYAGFITLDKYVYDNIGQLTWLQKQVGGNPLVNVATYSYDDLGRLQGKTDAPGYSNVTTGQSQLESLTYSYNLQSQVTGINKDYALKTSGVYGKWGHYFGQFVGYDNKNSAFIAPRLNGQVTGLMWNTQGDDAQRRYDYSYDNANRMINAPFVQQQHPGDGWSNSGMDFSISGYNGQISYDNNGNLLSMSHKGVIPGQSAPLVVDDLRYSYLNSGLSNKLQTVTDMMTVPTLNGLAGDFKDGSNGGNPDYVYDNNGNVVIDLNKNVQSLNNGAGGTPGIHYNYLDKPDQIRVVGKGTILIVYDAEGEKLQRAFVPEAGGSGTVTTYIDDYVYQETATLTTSSPAPFNGTNPHLAYMTFEEGRIRAMTPTATNNGYDGVSENGNIVLPSAPGGGYTSGAWDYFIRDYQENVRMILTEETHSAINVCTMETTNGRPAAEDPVFGQTGAGNEVEATRQVKPSAWTGNTSASAARVGNIFGHNLGPNSLQKVMAGDRVSASVQYYYAATSTSSNPNIVTNLLANLSSLIGNGPASAGTLVHGQAANVTSNLNGVQPFVNAVEPDNNTTGTPQAYVTILFFDERFNFIGSADGGVAQARVRSTDAGNANSLPLTLSNVTAPKNGYAYIYVSNRSDQDVYFDNLTISIAAGNLIEENHYYAYGLRIAAISSKKLGDAPEGKLANPYQYNGKEMLDEDAGLNWYDYGFRNYDPQISRFMQLDPLTWDYERLTPYQFAGDDPIANVDMDGLEPMSVVSAVSTETGNFVLKGVGASQSAALINAGTKAAHWESTLVDFVVVAKLPAKGAAFAIKPALAVSMSLALHTTMIVDNVMINPPSPIHQMTIEQRKVNTLFTHDQLEPDHRLIGGYPYRQGSTDNLVPDAIHKGGYMFIWRPQGIEEDNGFWLSAISLGMPVFKALTIERGIVVESEASGVYKMVTNKGSYIGQGWKFAIRIPEHFGINRWGKLGNFIGAKLKKLILHEMPGSTKLEREVYEHYLIENEGIKNLTNDVMPMGNRLAEYRQMLPQVLAKWPNLPR